MGNVIDDPFVVRVPAGATEIDLRPVLVPIVRKLMLVFSGDKAYSDKVVDEWLTKVHRDDRCARMVEGLDWRWIKNYMLATDWQRSCGSGGYHQYYPDKSEKYHRPWVCVGMQEEYNEGTNLVAMCWKAVKDIAKWEDRTFEAVCVSILAQVSVIDALASLAPGEG